MKSRTKVFVAGSRAISRLDRAVTLRLDNILKKEFTVVIGDANGIDKAVQKYFYSKRYRNVVVFYMDHGCRNNLGDWPSRSIAAPESKKRDFAYYSTKDRVMVEEADYGFMLWDGESRGTLRSIIHLVKAHKPVVVYNKPTGAFHELRNSAELAELLSGVDPSLLDGLEPELRSPDSEKLHPRVAHT